MGILPAFVARQAGSLTSDRLGVLVSDTKKAQFSEGFPGQGQIPPNEGKGDRYARTAFHSLEHPTNKLANTGQMCDYNSFVLSLTVIQIACKRAIL